LKNLQLQLQLQLQQPELLLCCTGRRTAGHPGSPPVLLQVVCVKDGMPTWVCEVCLHKPTLAEAIEAVKQVEQVRSGCQGHTPPVLAGIHQLCHR